LAAVTRCRLGDETTARQRCSEAWRPAPNQPLYADNLAVLDKLTGRGRGPWDHNLSQLPRLGDRTWSSMIPSNRYADVSWMQDQLAA
jgi:hypothetical protein